MTLKVAECLAIYSVARMNGLTRFPLTHLLSREITAKGTCLAESAGKEDPVEYLSIPPCRNGHPFV
jgi:hypothetical protein